MAFILASSTFDNRTSPSCMPFLSTFGTDWLLIIMDNPTPLPTDLHGIWNRSTGQYHLNKAITIFYAGQFIVSLVFKPKIFAFNFAIRRQCFYDLVLSCDPYGPARAFIAKLLRKSPYEGRTRWREQGRKKPSGPARIAYGSSRDAN